MLFVGFSCARWRVWEVNICSSTATYRLSAKFFLSFFFLLKTHNGNLYSSSIFESFRIGTMERMEKTKFRKQYKNNRKGKQTKVEKLQTMEETTFKLTFRSYRHDIQENI